MLDRGILNARIPRMRIAAPYDPGQHFLSFGALRESFLYVPKWNDPSTPSALILLLHGAGGHAHQGLALLQHVADEAGVILVAPASSDHTWDIIAERRYGADVVLLDQALEYVFARHAIDGNHIAIGGFSDGASYALSLGVTNGDLFTHIIAFSPGFIASGSRRGKPHIFISHGVRDEVLPIEPCSRRIAPQLSRAGYHVAYREFDGPHVVPSAIAQQATHWFINQR